MKRKCALFMTGLLLLSLLAGCAGPIVVVEQPETVAHTALQQLPAGSLKTGLAIVPGISKSVSASAESNGKAEYDVTVVAVTVDEQGVIRSCVIDSVGATSEFTAAGIPTVPGTVEVRSKNELGFDYGMVAYNASAIGKEWFEQAAALAEFAEGKTLEQVKAGISGGFASDVDLATAATIKLGDYVSGMEVAVANAKALGAEAGDELKLAVTCSLDASAAQGAGGMAQLNVDAAALTVSGETITSCTIDSLQAVVDYDGTGTITTDIGAAPKTKTQLGFEYGMVAYNASAIGREWFEQVENFCTYITGKTFSEVAGIAVTETTAPADADLAAGTTIAIGGFRKLIEKAAG